MMVNRRGAFQGRLSRGACLAGCLLAAGVFVAPSAEAVVLAEAGRSPIPVIVSSNAPPMTRQAANELAAYLEKAGGVRPPVIEGLPDPVPERAIWVGFQPPLRDLFPKTDFDFKQREEILIAAGERHLVIAGRDRWEPGTLQPRNDPYGTNYFGQQEYGTVNAVYTFLQDYLGVRWLWPGETGEDVPRQERIAFEPFEYRFHPPIRMRCGVMYWWYRPLQRGKLCADWSRLQRLSLDSSGNLFHPIANGHAFGDWWDRFHQSHPEYFALQPDGTRSGYPRPGTVKMCLSNPALWDAWLEDVARQLKEDPTRTCFSAAENDNCTAGYCVCSNCVAWDEPEAKKRLLVWEGLSQEYVALSDRQVRFANQLGRKLKERYPGKEYYVVIGGYGPSCPAPLKNKPDDNVILAFVGHLFSHAQVKDRWSLEPEGETFASQIAGWAAMGAKMAYRPNLPGEGGMYHGLPDVAFQRVMECHRFMATHNCVGFCFAAFWNFWPTQGPLYYLLAQLSWNPDQDGYRVLDDYYRRAYGPAAGTMKAYWTLLEETRNRLVDNSLKYWEAYDDAFFRRAGGLLEEAVARAGKASELYGRRVAYTRTGFDFTRLVVATHQMKAQYDAGRQQDAALAARLRENAKTLDGMVRGDAAYGMGPAYHFQNWLAGLAPEKGSK